MRRTIVLNDVEPALLSFRHVLGMNLDLMLALVDQAGSPVDPTLSQLVFRPRSSVGVIPYDVETYDAVNGLGRVQVPGIGLTDRNGYTIELYLRTPSPAPGNPPIPTSLAATGVVAVTGSAYEMGGPLAVVNTPVIVGPPGATGPAGRRGSIWLSGPGAPGVPTTPLLPGDMYLDETSGDVWRYDGEVWTMGSF